MITHSLDQLLFTAHGSLIVWLEQELQDICSLQQEPLVIYLGHGLKSSITSLARRLTVSEYRKGHRRFRALQARADTGANLT